MSDRSPVEEQIRNLGPWFHNIHLPGGIQTAPDHSLGDFPAFKWEQIKASLPEDLSGCSVLDIGCNAGFYSIMAAKRGARVTALDLDPHYLKQADWVIEQFDLTKAVTLKQMQVYDLAREEKKYDLVFFMGIFYHLRYPLLALDIVSKITGKQLLFQTLALPGEERVRAAENYPIHERSPMLGEGWPKMAFIENKFNEDPTNWWVPNVSCVEAMLRSCGLRIVDRPDREIFLAEPDSDHPGVHLTWNQSEYQSATGQSWKSSTSRKTGRRSRSA